MSSEDYYAILGVERGVGEDELKRAYRQLALKYHPDKNPGNKDAEDKFKKAAEAFDVLSDPDKRRKYDQFGIDGLRGSSGVRGFSGFEDIFDAFGDVFGGGIFDNIFGGGRRGAASGKNLRCEMTIELSDVVTGVEKTLDVTKKEQCPDCNGSGAQSGTAPVTCPYCKGMGEVQHSQGFFMVRNTCPKCNGNGKLIDTPCRKCRGSGRFPKMSTLTIKVPAGIDDLSRLRVTGQGECGEGGAPAGDLYCDIKIKPHAIFERRGKDIVCTLPITFPQAVLGCVVDVPTLDRKKVVQITIPKGTQNGDVLSVKNEGLSDSYGYNRGNLLVYVIVETPVKISARQEALLREFDDIKHRNANPKQKSFLKKMKSYFERG